ncbi:hypothetical protein NBRC116583_28150 [Arenicella sp. 4NH20-0111]|uniref:hypothetical protein n=1 Tax=Arenicella sp. 4NH20-0111 TaxID=3127648 RepID=UPI00310677B9
MKKILSVIALLALITVGAKFYIEHRYKQELDKVIQSASLFVDIAYDDLNVGFDGTVELLDLRITPNETFETISVQSITLSGLDLLFHFNGKSQLEKGEYPDALNFSVDQLSFSASTYEKLFEEEECKSLSGTLRYTTAGFDQIVTSGKLIFDLSDPYAASVEFSGQDQISRTSYSVNFNARQANPIAIASDGIPIQSMRYDFFLEKEAADQMLGYCANKFNIKPEQFLEQVVKSKRFMTNSFSMDLGDAARKGLVEFIQGGKELVVRSTPSDRLKNINFVSTSSPLQIVRMLNLNVSLDGSTIPIRTMQSQIGTGETDSDSMADADVDSEGFKRRGLDELLNSPDGTVQERSRPKLKRKRKNNYERATLSNVNSYIDRDIRVSRTKDRSPIEGRLLGVEEQVLSIEIYRYGGVMTYTVPYSDVSRLELKKR